MNCRISTTGLSEYRLNNQVVTAQAYTAALANHNILVKAKNFLVFQGDVEHIASQNSKDLCKLVEQISGSLELATDYERAKKAVEKASENATESFHKKRSFQGELKVFQDQMAEAERFEEILNKRVNSLNHIECYPTPANVHAGHSHPQEIPVETLPY